MDALKYSKALQAEARRRLNEARARYAPPSEQLPILQELNSYDSAIAALTRAEIMGILANQERAG